MDILIKVFLDYVRRIQLKIKKFRTKDSPSDEEGFTLIELLVVLIIIGILAAISVPSFVSQANKARESEAKTYVSSLVTGQSNFFLENLTFTADFADLNVFVPTSTQFYTYKFSNVSNEEIIIDAEPVQDSLKGYSARIYTLENNQGSLYTASILCEGNPGENPAMSGRVLADGCPE